MSTGVRNIEDVFDRARREGRGVLFEHEIYEWVAALGVATPPDYVWIPAREVADADLSPIAGDRIVLKIVHPRIIHKSDVGGVIVVSRGDARLAAERMLHDVPEQFLRHLQARSALPEDLAAMDPDLRTQTVAGETEGVLAVEWIPSSGEFSHELLLGMRDTPEFGPVMTVSVGGLDTEFFADALRRERGGLTHSPGVGPVVLDAATLERVAAFATLTGRTRGHTRAVSDRALDDLLRSFAAAMERFSSLNPDANVWLSEFELNPLRVRDGAFVPVDGFLRFRSPTSPATPPPVEKLRNLLQPENVCLIGVSAKSVNVGRIMLRNLLAGRFTADRVAVVRPDGGEIDGVTCYPGVADLPHAFDVVILSVDATQVAGTVRDLITHEKAQAIVLVTGGMGERVGGRDGEAQLRAELARGRSRPDRGPVLVGGNSLGIISAPGGYDTFFIPETRLPRNAEHPLGRNVALLSQSGAFIITRMSRRGGFVPRYAVSTGNQVDLTVSDFVEHCQDDPDVRVVACYVEGFRADDGLRFARAARRAREAGKDVIVYKAGRTAEGRHAASGHTATVAGDWTVACAVLEQAGCAVARSFDEWSDLVMVSSLLAGRAPAGGRLGAISNAGYETVGMADALAGAGDEISLATFAPETRDALRACLDAHHLGELQDIRNPLDLTPMASDAAHRDALSVITADPNVDLLLHACVPLTPAMRTRERGVDGDGIDDPDSFPRLLVEVDRRESTPPLVTVIDAGSLYDPLADLLLANGIPVFRSADTAVATLGRWLTARRS